MTDFRALCAELLQELCCHYRSWELKEGYCSDAMTRAQAALAQPKPQGLSKAELRQLFDDQSGYINDEQVMWWADFHKATRAVLARWGRPAIEPVPVAERLPGPEDLTDEHFGVEWCWWGKRFAGGWEWHQGGTGYGTMPGEFSYWLPHHALPVPQQEHKK